MTQPKSSEASGKLILPTGATRREFMKSSGLATGAALVGGTLAGMSSTARYANAQGSGEVKVALIGCGGRGTGAASDMLASSHPVKNHRHGRSVLRSFERRLKTLQNSHSNKVDVPKERQFVGFDAFQNAIDSGVDMVILATPPGFRPMQFEAAVKAGKHVFMEKPVATDPSGVRQVLAAAKLAKEKNLGVGVGLQRRHQQPYLETIARLQDGAIGDIVAARVYWNGSTPWVRTRESLEKQAGRKLSEMEYQLRNWYYFTWICGDHIVEQHIHNLDVINWLKGKAPSKANGMGGCQVRKGKDYGETFDHHFIEFEYDDGTKMFSQCRHIPNCFNSVSEHVHGTKGSSTISSHNIKSKDGDWKFDGKTAKLGKPGNPYQVEHQDLLDSIAKGTPYNEGESGAMSTMTAILGRMATYSGKELKMEDALNSKISIMPKSFAFDAETLVKPGEDGMYPVAMPGITQVV
ncbi:MAG: Gfo/Idh/MocA family oxidoreductase [Pirellulales bacterium]